MGKNFGIIQIEFIPIPPIFFPLRKRRAFSILGFNSEHINP